MEVDALHDGAVYYVATDPRVEPKLRRMLAPLGPVEQLHVLLVDRDDLAAIPPDAPTFLMTSARAWLRERAPGVRLPGRPIQPPRVLSDASARDLLAFLVQANVAALGAPDAPRPVGTSPTDPHASAD